jgi:hypothetical protein
VFKVCRGLSLDMKKISPAEAELINRYALANL